MTHFEKLALIGLLGGRLLRLGAIVTLGCGLRCGEFLLDLFAHAALASVVGDIPTFAFELKRRLRNHFFQAPPAILTSRRGFVGHLLDYFNLITAFLTLEFVNWHR